MQTISKLAKFKTAQINPQRNVCVIIDMKHFPLFRRGLD